MAGFDVAFAIEYDKDIAASYKKNHTDTDVIADDICNVDVVLLHQKHPHIDVIIVLDNTFGSGSFLVAALMEGRNFIGIEKNEDVALFKKDNINYIDVAKHRLFFAWNELSKKAKKGIAVTNLISEFEEK